jgi:hypothetical protein
MDPPVWGMGMGVQHCVSLWDNSVDSWINISEGSTATLYYDGDRVFKYITIKEAR